MRFQPINEIKSPVLIGLIDWMWQLHLGALCIGIYKWAQSDQNDKRENSIAVSEANLLSVCVL